jgi:hypothetical protein
MGQPSPAKGVVKSAEWRRKIAISVSLVTKGEKNPFWGRHHTEETKRKISETKRLNREAKEKRNAA